MSALGGAGAGGSGVVGGGTITTITAAAAAAGGGGGGGASSSGGVGVGVGGGGAGGGQGSHLGGGQEPEPHKRKRDADDNGAQSSHADRIPQPPPPQSGTATPINYLSRATAARLKLIQGDGEIFSDVLGLISEYEGVLSRHESLAANLGAKLTGPRLLKAMEGVFDGPIITAPHLPYSPAGVTWLDIVGFAKSNPSEFSLVTIPDRGRVCQFFLKGVQVEIAEDDWRLIMSGALDRFRLVPAHPLEEDETAELATLDILEQRLQTLIKKADEVARKARQLNYHLMGRKAGINARRSSPQPQASSSSSSAFHAVNQSPRAGGGGGGGGGGGPNPGYDLHADLLQQFLSTPTHSSSTSRVQSASSIPNPPLTPSESSRPRSTPAASQQHLLMGSRPSPAQAAEPLHARDAPAADDPSAMYRPLIQARIEKLARGETIVPPCDRCRRLKTQCIKHLTACQGCTRKHAKCSWKAITEDEVGWLKSEAGSMGVDDIDEDEPDPADVLRRRSLADPDAAGRDGARALHDLTSRGMALEPGLRLGINDLLTGSPESMGSGSRGESTEMDIDSRVKPRELDRRDYAAARDHSMLSHMASVATAAAEAREARAALSRDSSTSKE